MKHIRKYFFTLLAAAALLASCSAPKLAYFQDTTDGQSRSIQTPEQIKLRPDDKITIVVKSKDPELSTLFNLPITGQRVGDNGSQTGSSQQMSCYTIDKYGDIDFPILGQLSISGMTRGDVAKLVKDELINQNLVKDPVVTVEFANLGFSVLGEVKSPGHYDITKDRMTVLDALSKAGDLTIYGQRENVIVFRKVGDKELAYTIDLRSADNVMSSPVYTLQQDDIIYVAPNDKKTRESTVNGNTLISTSFWISIATLAVTVANLLL